MRRCKEERVFWEHHQTARVIPLFKMCPEDTGLSHLLPFLLCSACVLFLVELHIKKCKVYVPQCHSKKSRVLQLAHTGSYENMPKYPTLRTCLVSDYIRASYALTCVRLSVFHDFLLDLKEGCKFLEGCVCLNVWCLTGLVSHVAQVWVVPKASLYHRPCFKWQFNRASLQACVWVSAGGQVMSFLTAVEMVLLQLSTFYESSPVSSQHIYSHIPPSLLLAFDFSTI